jgi:hypothetical protein
MRPATLPSLAEARTRPATLPRIAGWLCVAAMLALASPGVRVTPIDAPPGHRHERGVEAPQVRSPGEDAVRGTPHPPVPRSAREPSDAEAAEAAAPPPIPL